MRPNPRSLSPRAHAADSVGLLGVSSGELCEARSEALEAFSRHLLSSDELAALVPLVRGWIRSWRPVSLEVIFSVLWRVRWPVARFFPRRVRERVSKWFDL